MSETNAAERHENDITPRIYVASLADCVGGRLHGRWIDADQPIETIRDQIAAMLAESGEPIAEEWVIHDYEGFGSLHISEFEDIEPVAHVAHLMAEHGLLIAELASYFGGTSGADEAVRYMEEGYHGAFGSLAEYAEELIEDCWADALRGLPEFIKYHIDYDGIGRDLELGGDIFSIEHEGKLHVFDSCI